MTSAASANWFAPTVAGADALCAEFGTQASVNDTIWRILNLQVTKRRSHHYMEMAYYEMARLASLEAKDPKPYLVEALRTHLLGLECQGVKDAGR